VSDEAEELTILTAASAAQGAVLTPEGNDVVVTEKS
jgi:hypothetical protein